MTPPKGTLRAHVSPAQRESAEAHVRRIHDARRTSWTAADLLAASFPEPRWAVPGIIPEGLTLLVGPPKLGKSWFALDLVVATAAGGRALGRVPVEQGEALYMALEDPPRRLQQRLNIILKGDRAPSGLHIETAWPAMNDGGAEKLKERLTGNPKIRIVVVDVLARVRGTVSEREDRYAADYRCLIQLKGIADRYGVALVVLHHTRKQTSEDFLDTVSGTQGIAGAADTILVLQRSRGTSDATLHVTGRDVEETAKALSLEGGTSWRLLDGNAEEQGMHETRRRVRSLLRDEGPMAPKEIAEILGLDPAAVRQTCKRMYGDQQLDNKAGTYSLRVTPVTLSLESDEVTAVTPLQMGGDT